MEEQPGDMVERIVRLTLEIIYLLTGETPPSVYGEYLTIKMPPRRSLVPEHKTQLKILEVTNKITELLTGKFSIKCEDVAVYFSMEERKYLERHQELYKDNVIEDQQSCSSLDGAKTSPERSPRPLYPPDSLQEDRKSLQHNQNEDLVIMKVEEEEDTEETCVRSKELIIKREMSPEIGTDRYGEKNVTLFMASRKRSSIWNHFEEVGPHKAKCKICKNIYSSLGGSTSNFKRHLESKHPTTMLMQFRPEDPARSASPSILCGIVGTPGAESTATSVSGTFIQRSRQSHITSNARPPTGLLRQSKIDEELVKMIALDLQPTSIVDDKGFSRFLKAIDPIYILPSRKTLSATLLPQLYNKTKAEVMVKVSNASAVCLTTDCWTSRTTTSFLAVTCHYIDDNFKLISSLLDCFSFTNGYTADHLAAELKKICEDWGITNKVVACVSDNASNLKAAIRKAGWKNVACFAQMLNLIVRESLKKIRETVAKVKSVVEYVNRSTVATDRLKATQRQMGLEELRLKQDVGTSWNSTYYMLKRFWEQKEAVVATLDLVSPTLTLDEWDIVKDACDMLKPFEEVAVEIGADRYVTASKVILMARGLQKVIQRLRGALSNHGPVIEMIDTLTEEMHNHFHQIEHFSLLAEATLLDPRFKQRAFHDVAAADEAAKNVTTAAKRVGSSTQPQAGLADLSATSQSEQAASFWEDFDERVADAVAICNPTSTAMSEMRGYLAESLIPRTEDPLAWWKARQTIYEGLTAVMKRRLCIVATSVPAERMFSKAGQTISDRRTRLSPSKVRQLIFLNANIASSADRSL